MVEKLLYYIFSTIEFSGVFMLTLALFRMKLKAHTLEIIGSSAICALVSLLLYTLEVHNAGIALQIVALILCVKFIFYIDFWRSVIIGVFGYGAFLLVQGMLLTLFDVNGIIDIKNIEQTDNLTHMLQVATTILAFTISIVIKKTNQGFGYLIDRIFSGTTTSRMIVAVSSFTGLLIGLSFYLFYLEQVIMFFIFTILILVTFTSLMTYYFIKRDNEYYKIR